ncbi:MAG: hypothetical protein M5R41_14280 [Bacteroidia bacterium]|nr:hypothetical protein [Bacteroidia bacterium]
MTTIFCSHKLSAFLGSERFTPVETAEPSPLGDWNAHTFHIGRSRILVFVNNRTLYCVFMHDVKKADLRDIETAFLRRMMEQLFYEHIVRPAEAMKIDRMMRPIVLARSNNDKRTIGVMNEFVWQLKAQLASEYHYRTAFAELNRLANVLPVGRGKSGGKKYLMPGEEMMALIDGSGIR